MTVIVNKRVIATLNFPTTIPAFIIYLRGLYLKLTGNANVPLPYPLLTTTLAAGIANCNILESAEALVQTHVSGSKSARDTAHDVCKKDARSIRNMVQQLADNNISATVSSTTIITSAGFGVKTAGVKKTTVFEAKNTKISGKVKIVAPPIPKSRGTHLWTYTADAVGFTGKVVLPQTIRANTTVEGLIPLTKYAFFHSTVSITGTSTEEGPIFLAVV